MAFTLTPFWEAELAVQVHIIFALFAMVAGAAIFWRRKGTRWHRLTGRFWFCAMAIVSVSSFFIHGLRVWGVFSPLHLLSVWTLATLAFALVMVRRGNIRAHEYSLKGLYLGGIVFAGTLTLSKGLTMHRIVFGETGGQFMPAPGELPSGPIGTAIMGAFIIVAIVVLRANRTRVARTSG